VKAALEAEPHGLVDNWLRHIRDIYHRRMDDLAAIENESDRLHRLCEWNVVEQVVNVGNTTIVQDAWQRGQRTAIHGWIYDIADGLLKDLDVCIESHEQLKALQEA
jgi:carbonic anhydrase